MLGLAAALSVEAGAPEDFRDKIRPILQRHCYECHGPEKQKGDLDLAAFSEYEKVIEAPEVWALALERVQAYEMPPKEAKELSFERHRDLVRWLRNLPKPQKPDCDQIASDRNANFYSGYVMSRRLNRAEYHNTIRDLLGVNLSVEELLPADGGGGEGFDTTGSALFTSTIHIEKYLAAADRVLTTALPEKTWKLPPEIKKARDRILVAKPSLFGDRRKAARDVVTAFASRAWRRPVTGEEVHRLLTMFDRGYQRGDGFVPSVRLALKGVLVSPNFLFLAELEPEKAGVHRLGAFPLATRLSYFLWSSMPDDELLALANNGRILDTNVYRQQIKRMLADPKAAALGERFALQWLDLEELGREKRPDPTKFPEFDPALNAAMRDEVIAYFNHIIRNDRPLLEIIDSDYTFVNARLAQIYGVEGVTGSAMQRVKVSSNARGGVLGMAAVHTSTSYPLRTSPVLRGRWILESLLGERVPMPPPDVPALEENPEKAGHLSLREQLEAHRTKSECASCHDRMDPLGFGLEHFDVLGRWRDQDRDQPIDAKGKLPSGETYDGPAGLKKVLLERKDRVMRHLVRKMTGYAYGRELNRFDDCVIDRTMEALQKNDYRSSVLVEQIATSFPFQHRFYPKGN
jgi:hypothetical protein